MLPCGNVNKTTSASMAGGMPGTDFVSDAGSISGGGGFTVAMSDQPMPTVEVFSAALADGHIATTKAVTKRNSNCFSRNCILRRAKKRCALYPICRLARHADSYF